MKAHGLGNEESGWRFVRTLIFLRDALA